MSKIQFETKKRNVLKKSSYNGITQNNIIQGNRCLIVGNSQLKLPLEYLQEGRQVPEICELYGLSKLKFFALYKADLITFIKKLGSEGKTRKQIAKIMGICFDSVKKYKKMDADEWKEPTKEQIATIKEWSMAGINPKGISSEMKIPIDWVYSALKPDILLTFVQSNLQTAIERFGMDARTLSIIIQGEGLTIPSSNVATRIIDHYGNGEFPYYKPMSNRLTNIVEGELKGDGHIRKNYYDVGERKDIRIADYEEIMEYIKEIKEANDINNIPNFVEKYNKIVQVMENVYVSSFQMTKAIKELPWNEYIAKLFREEGYNVNIRIYEEKCYCEIQSSVQLQELRDKWYTRSTKVLSKDYKPNPTNLLHQYEGDGCYHRKAKRIDISTQNFTEVENHKMADLIKQEMGIDVRVYKDHWKGREYFRLWINRNADVEKFFQYLERADKESLEMAKKTVPHKFPLKFLPPDIRRKVVGMP